MTRTVQPGRTFASLFIPLMIILIVALAVAGPAYAEEHSSQCGMGEVQSVFQALPIGVFNVGDTRGGLGAGAAHCRYQMAIDGTSVSFHSSDMFFGGFANFIPFEYLGISQEEAIELLLSSEDAVYLGPAGAPLEDLVEQELMHTAVKRTKIPGLGRVVYQNIGFITQLEPGEYVSYYVGDWIFGPETATVSVTILP